MSYNERCLAEDNKRCKECGWDEGSWVGVNYAKPETEAERRAVDLLKRLRPDAVTLHVYTIAELLVLAFQEAIDDHKEES